ncbi:hypothetical protein L2E82_10594 [Cichorium intybus]|uniref:Uncharacterized protein n=1 Tax=Cichorium intybus TaxID=13427 RepID=A0ACB9GAH3_CICIN|nr:hypothetical protein L2E82_10594 [Cichorium intybus]
MLNLLLTGPAVTNPNTVNKRKSKGIQAQGTEDDETNYANSSVEKVLYRSIGDFLFATVNKITTHVRLFSRISATKELACLTYDLEQE